MSRRVDWLQAIARVRVMLANMAKDFGLGDLSDNERSILYAAAEQMKQPDDLVHTGKLLNSPLVAGISNPTFYRAIGILVERGFLVKDEDCKRGEYRLNNPKA